MYHIRLLQVEQLGVEECLDDWRGQRSLTFGAWRFCAHQFLQRPRPHVSLLYHGDLLPVLSPSMALHTQPLPEYTGVSGHTETKISRRRKAVWHGPPSGGSHDLQRE